MTYIPWAEQLRVPVRTTCRLPLWLQGKRAELDCADAAALRLSGGKGCSNLPHLDNREALQELYQLGELGFHMSILTTQYEGY